MSLHLSHLAAVGGDDTEVSRNPVSSFHLHQVSCHNLLGIDLHLLPLTDYQGLLGTEREGERCVMPKLIRISINYLKKVREKVKEHISVDKGESERYIEDLGTNGTMCVKALTARYCGIQGQ